MRRLCVLVQFAVILVECIRANDNEIKQGLMKLRGSLLAQRDLQVGGKLLVVCKNYNRRQLKSAGANAGLQMVEMRQSRSSWSLDRDAHEANGQIVTADAGRIETGGRYIGLGTLLLLCAVRRRLSVSSVCSGRGLSAPTQPDACRACNSLPVLFLLLSHPRRRLVCSAYHHQYRYATRINDDRLLLIYPSLCPHSAFRYGSGRVL